MKIIKPFRLDKYSDCERYMRALFIRMQQVELEE